MAGGAPNLMQVLRAADPDRYLSTLYAPGTLRPALTALYAFNAEIATIRDRVSQPMPGEIRLQWWRDALSGGGEAAAGNPLAVDLVAVMERHRLPRSAFDRTLEARVFDLYDDPMPGRANLEGYCGETASTVIQLAALILDPKAAPDFAEAAGHAGCVQAIAGLLRLLPIHAARGQCYVPADILASAGTDRDAFVGGQDRPAALRAVAAMVALGREHDARFRSAAEAMPASLRPAFLPAGLAPAYLGRIAKRDPLREIVDISVVRRHWTLFRQATSGFG